MDGLNKGSRAGRDESPDLLSGGLILWRLSIAGHSDLWCMVFEFPDGFFCVVDDDPEGPRPYTVHEQHPDIVSLVNRAEALKGSLLQCGWAVVDVE